MSQVQQRAQESLLPPTLNPSGKKGSSRRFRARARHHDHGEVWGATRNRAVAASPNKVVADTQSLAIIARQAARNSVDALVLGRMDLVTAVGGVAAFCTTVSYFPQLRKCWQTGQTGDLSLMMFSVLAAGVALWIVYGLLKSDIVIIAANAISLALLLGILYFKLRESRGRT
jgi:MtN3 and saliva related transmembrane protein